MKKKLNNLNLKTITSFILGVIISGGVVYAATIAASQVSYTKNGQSTVEGALDVLYTRSNTTIANLQSQVSTLQSQYEAAQAACPSGQDCVKKVETDTDTPTEYDINGEKFYVIWSNQYETALIAKYNVSTSTRKQVESGAETVAFSSSTYWYDTTNEVLKTDYTANGASFSGNPYPYVYNSQSNLYAYLNEYKTDLNSSKVKLVRLATYEELENLGCTASDTCPSWIKNTYFWTGSALNSNFVWLLDADYGSLFNDYYSNRRRLGVRPVIVVSTSEL